MDDTAFHYSRTLRIIMALAIIIPVLGIGLLLWYFTSVDVPETVPANHVEAEEAAAANHDDSFQGLILTSDNVDSEGD